MSQVDSHQLFKGHNFSPFLKGLQREMAADVYERERTRLLSANPQFAPWMPEWDKLNEQQQKDFIKLLDWAAKGI